MRDTLEEIKEQHGRISLPYITARFLELRHYHADTISDFLHHREELARSSYFVMAEPNYSRNPLDLGSYTNIILVTLRGPYHYEEQEGVNVDLSSPGLRRTARETTFWLYCSGYKEPCVDMTPNAEISDNTGTLKVLSGLDVQQGRAIYSPTLAYHRESKAVLLYDGFFLKGNGRKKKRKRMKEFEFAVGLR
ncbi:hypothetical protein HYT52_02700 [Candidatus Woesearchaeota archaeon]|nr:hypothetical protein [Candidatus Woesearchaeota archaeon]